MTNDFSGSNTMTCDQKRTFVASGYSTKKTAVCCMLLTILFASSMIMASQDNNFQYDPHGKRDPFVSLLSTEKPSILKLEDITSAEDIRLEGVAVGAKGERVAILNGEMVKEKSRFGDIVIKQVLANKVLITFSGKEHIISLPEEGGTKSE